MKIAHDCVGCIVNQSLRVADAIGADMSLRNELYSTVSEMSHHFSFELSPPEVASDVYETMAQLASKEDLYDEMKQHATAKALELLPSLQKKLASSSNKLLTATKIAVAGNVIDLAAEVCFDLDEELGKIFDTPFTLDDFMFFQEQLQHASDVVVLGDNAGEHIFDYLFIQTIQTLYPQVRVSYFVRGRAIINDVTLKEAKEAGFESLCHLVDSGVNTPGFAYDRANTQARELFDNADVVISKGMGNYECLSPSHRDNIFFLLKVKCGVVAQSIGAEIGDIVCKKGCFKS